MRCNNCGKEIKDGSQFCKYCGIKCTSSEIENSKAINKGKKKYKWIVISLIIVVLGIDFGMITFMLLKSSEVNHVSDAKVEKTAEKSDTEIDVIDDSNTTEDTADKDVSEDEYEDIQVANNNTSENTEQNQAAYENYAPNVESLNIRANPAHKSNLVITVDANANLMFYGEVEQGYGSDGILHAWYKIYLNSGESGWARSDLIHKVN